MANLTPVEYINIQFPNRGFELISAVRVDSPTSKWKPTVQRVVVLIKVAKKEAMTATLWTNEFESDGTTLKKQGTGYYFEIEDAVTYDKSKSEMEVLVSDKQEQLKILNRRIAEIKGGGWVITQDPWDPNIVPKSLNTTQPVEKPVEKPGEGPVVKKEEVQTDAVVTVKPINPLSIIGKFSLKVKSGPGVIIGITDVDIVDGKADFEGIQFDQAGDYVVSISSSSPDIDTLDIKITVLPEQDVIPQDSKGEPDKTATWSRPIIAQIDPPILPIYQMEFTTGGASPTDANLVASSMGNLPLFNYNGSIITHKDIQTLRLYHDGMIPKVKILFTDTNEVISKNPPQDDTTFEIFIKSWSDNLKSPHLVFKVEDHKKLENKQYTITGTIDLSELYRMKFKVYKGTSFNVIIEICKDLKIGFNSNIENTADEMPWRSIGDRPHKFL